MTKNENSTPKGKKPFYKRVWFWVVVVIIVIGAGSQMGENSSSSNSSNSSSSKSSSKATSKSSSSSSSSSSKAKTYAIGQTFTAGKMQYTVNAVSSAKQVGPSALPKTATDTYLVVDLTVKNNDSKEVTVDANYFNLLDGKKTFKADSAASISANQNESGEITNSFFLQKLNPDVSMSGKVVFDVSAAEASSTTNQLQVQTGVFGTQKAIVNLH